MSRTKRRRSRDRQRPADRGQLVALSLLGLTVVGAPLLLGGVPGWARLLIGASSWLSLAAALWATLDRGRRVQSGPPRAWLWLGVGLLALTGLQLLPLPLSWLSWLAPESADALTRTQAALGLPPPASGALSMDPGATLAALLQGLGLVSAACAAWLLAANGRRQIVLWAVAASGAVMALVALGHEAAAAEKVFGLYEPLYVHPHPLSPLLNLNHLSALLSVGAVVSLGLGAKLRGGQRVAGLVLSVVLVTTTLLTGSRGGVASLLGAMVLFGLMARFESRRQRTAGRLGVAAALAAGVGLGAYLALEPLLRQLGDSSVDNKLEFAERGLGIALQHPWLGVGRGAFGSASSQIWGTTSRALYPENLPTQWAAEWGLPATLLALGVLGVSVLSVFRRRRSPPRLAAAIALVMLFAHELADFSLELAGVGTVAAVLFGATVGRAKGKAGRLSARRLMLGLAVLGLLALATLGPRSLRVDSLAEQQALEGMLAAGEPEAFHRRLARAMEAHPQDAAFPLIGGAEAVARGAREALPLLNRAMLLAPGWASPHELTARWLWRRERRDQALGELRQVAARDPRLAAPLMCRILRASPQAELALRAAPAGEQGLSLLNRAARCMRRHPEVAEAIDAEILRRDAEALDPQLRRMQRLKVSGDLPGALRLGRRTLRRQPGRGKLTLALARLLVDADRGGEALELLGDGEALGDPEAVLRVQAAAHASRGDATAMRHAIDRLRGLAAGKARPLAAALREQARLELVLGNRAQALVALGRAQRLQPTQGTLLQMARLAERMGARRRANALYRELLRDAPDNATYQRALERTGGGPR